MARINRFPLAMAVFSAVMASQAHALGLGDITLHSALNQPLDAEIALLQVGDLTSEELAAHLANAATFERLGVDRPTFLQNLRFTPVIRGGRSYIHVVSSQPVREPYLNFLVELERPNGSLMREYTLLLDPPGYGETRSYGSYADTASQRASTYASSARPAARPAAPRQARKPAVPATAGDGRYTTVSGDSLWGISGRFAGNGMSRQTFMAQLQQLNPQAFVGGNPHRLRVGQTLVLPAATAATATTAPAPAANAAPAAGGQASVAAPAVATQTQVDQAQNQLSEMNAQRDRLNQRMDDLQKQLTNLQQTLQNRDQQVQNLEAELARRQAAAQPAPAAAPAPAAGKPAAAVAAPAASTEADAGLVRHWPWAAAAGAVLLVLGLMYGRRRKDIEQEPPRVQPHAASLPPQQPVRPAAVAKPQVAVAAAAAAVVPVAAEAATLAKLPTASSDSLEGANIYIAYGRFGQARDMLVKAIAAEPQRRELRMKLLLVLAELGEVGPFHEQEKALLAMGGDQKQIDQLKTRYPAMQERQDEQIGDTLGEWEGLELGEVVAAPSPGEEPLLGDNELNLGDMHMDLDWSSLDPFDAPKSSAKGGKPEPEVVLEDFRSNLRELPEVTEFDLDGEHAGAFGLPSRAVVGAQDKLLAGLDEARACIDRGDLDQAYSILKRVLEDGDSQEREEARELLARIA